MALYEFTYHCRIARFIIPWALVQVGISHAFVEPFFGSWSSVLAQAGFNPMLVDVFFGVVLVAVAFSVRSRGFSSAWCSR